MFVFFCFKQKTAYEMRISDWSSDVCSSDLLRPYEGKALKDGQVISEFQLKSDVLLDEVRAGGRIPLIIGRGLTAKARISLGLPPTTLFRLPESPVDSGKGRSEEHTSELQSLMRISYAFFCLKKKK